MDDILAVLDAVGTERAVLIGMSEGAPAALRSRRRSGSRVQELVLCGGMARSTWAEDYPWATPARSSRAGDDGSGSVRTAPTSRSGHRRGPTTNRRSPGWGDTAGRASRPADARPAIPDVPRNRRAVRCCRRSPVPTLVLHRRGDRVVNRRAGEWMASQIPGAQYVELAGQDHFPWSGDIRGGAGERSRGIPHRAGVTSWSQTGCWQPVLFTDIVGSTDHASELGDRAWRKILDQHDAGACPPRAPPGPGGQVDRRRVLATFDGPGVPSGARSSWSTRAGAGHHHPGRIA